MYTLPPLSSVHPFPFSLACSINSPYGASCIDQAKIKTFVEEQNLRYPMVLLGDKEGVLRLVMDHQELARCDGKADVMVEKLRGKGVLSERETISKI